MSKGTRGKRDYDRKEREAGRSRIKVREFASTAASGGHSGVASTAASGGRVVGRPPTSTGVSLAGGLLNWTLAEHRTVPGGSADTRRQRRVEALQRPGGGAESRVPAVVTLAAPSPRSAARRQRRYQAAAPSRGAAVQRPWKAPSPSGGNPGSAGGAQSRRCRDRGRRRRRIHAAQSPSAVYSGGAESSWHRRNHAGTLSPVGGAESSRRYRVQAAVPSQGTPRQRCQHMLIPRAAHAANTCRGQRCQHRRRHCHPRRRLERARGRHRRAPRRAGPGRRRASGLRTSWCPRSQRSSNRSGSAAQPCASVARALHLFQLIISSRTTWLGPTESVARTSPHPLPTPCARSTQGSRRALPGHRPGAARSAMRGGAAGGGAPPPPRSLPSTFSLPDSASSSQPAAAGALAAAAGRRPPPASISSL